VTALFTLIGDKFSGKAKPQNLSFFAAVFIAALSLSFTIGCAGDTCNIVRIEERLFATHLSHIYVNAIDYLGRTVQLEGVFLKKWWGWPYYAPFRYFVKRFVPGHCCGGFIGFEVKWSEKRSLPEYGSWVEATGTLGADSALNLYLKLSSLIVLDERGEEMVTQ